MNLSHSISLHFSVLSHSFNSIQFNSIHLFPFISTQFQLRLNSAQFSSLVHFLIPLISSGLFNSRQVLSSVQKFQFRPISSVSFQLSLVLFQLSFNFSSVHFRPSLVQLLVSSSFKFPVQLYSSSSVKFPVQYR